MELTFFPARQVKFKALVNFLNSLNLLVLDILFPVQCLSCAKNGTWLCTNCQRKLPILQEHLCGVCERAITPDGRTCLACKRKSTLTGFLSAISYQEPVISKAVHLYKYRFIKDLHVPLGNLMLKIMLGSEMPLPDLIVPVPLHKRRLRWRGFNQSAMLANHIAANLLPNHELSVQENILARSRYTAPQMTIKNYADRQQNMHGAFTLTDPTVIKNKKILLIDDVATTGSTIFECARVLKAAGASEIWALVIARQNKV